MSNGALGAFLKKYGLLIFGIAISCITIALVSFAYINTNKLDEFLRLPDKERKVFIIQSQQAYLQEFKKLIGLYDQEISIKNLGKGDGHHQILDMISKNDLPSYREFLQAKKILDKSDVTLQKEKALALLESSARQKSFAAQYYLAAYQLENKKPHHAMKLLNQAALDNGAVAQIYLALLFGQGQIFPRNIQQSLYWADKAVKSGNASAMYVKAMMLSEWDGYPHNLEKAVELFKDAAEKGHARSQFMLASMYFNGKFVERNIEEALKWTVLASKQSLAEAEYAIGRMATAGIGMKTDSDLAKVWVDRAAHHGLPEAQYDMALNYMNVSPVRRDVTAGAIWFYYAAMNGYVDAQAKLGYMYSIGLGVRADREQAIFWLNKAAEAGNQQALIWLDSVKQQPADGYNQTYGDKSGQGIIKYFSGAVIRG